ncbi:hypothetical protein pb186bvf_000382 [Paramecium bursaria]
MLFFIPNRLMQLIKAKCLVSSLFQQCIHLSDLYQYKKLFQEILQ